MKYQQANRYSPGMLFEKTALGGICRSVAWGLVLLAWVGGCNRFINHDSASKKSLLKLTDSKDPESAKPSQGTQFIGDVCAIWGLHTARIEGIGLVTGLKGTGSSPEPSGQRDYLEADLRNHKDVKNAKAALTSLDTSMVLIRAVLPPGIRKGDRFDIEIHTLPRSKTASLEHGHLIQARLRPMMPTGRSVKMGIVNALAAGPVLVDSLYESRQDEPNQQHGWVLGGGLALEDRKLGLKVRTENSKVRLTRAIAWTINKRFTDDSAGEREDVAEPKTDRVIELTVPPIYKLNIGRYFQVLMYMAINEPGARQLARLDGLSSKILDPDECAIAALELEAIGEPAIPILTRAIHHPDLKIQFHAAQALAYLQQSDGVDVLRRAAEIEPAYRWHAQTALATLDHPSAIAQLVALMQVSSAETRYGAFRAIRRSNPDHPAIEGRWLGDEFFFHVIPSSSDPLLHISRAERPEIVLFGESQTVTDDFLYIQTGLTVRSLGNGRVQVIRYLPGDSEIRKTCSVELAELIPLLANVGCDYSTLVRMLRQARKGNMLNARVAVNAVPPVRNLEDAESQPNRVTTESDPVDSDEADELDGNPVPNLFDDPPQETFTIRRPGDSSNEVPNVEPPVEADSAVDSANAPETDSAAPPDTVKRRKGWFQRIREWFGG